MEAADQQAAFDEELTKLIDRYMAESDLTNAQVIGLLHLKSAEIATCALDNWVPDHFKE